MYNTRQIDVGTLLADVSSLLAQNAGVLNNAGGAQVPGSHGTRMAQAFQAAAQAANNSDSDDAGAQLRAAAQAMRQHGRGKAAQLYANGLDQAAQQFAGRTGVTLDALQPFLQSLLSGVQQGNPAQPGQGSMIDAIFPAVSAYTAAKQQGLLASQAAMQAVSAAVSGARSTANRPADVPWDNGKHPLGQNGIDPGAASAAHVVAGVVGALLPHAFGDPTQGGASDMNRAISQPPLASTTAQSSNPLGGLHGLLDDALGFVGPRQ